MVVVCLFREFCKREYTDAMDGNTLKIAAAGCFGLIIVATSVSARFDVHGSLANVFTTLGGSEQTEIATGVPVPTTQEWRSSLSKYTTINPDIASSTAAIASSSMTMTDTFTRSMFEMYLRNREDINTPEARAAFGEEYGRVFRASLEPIQHTEKDIVVQNSVALYDYVIAVTEALRTTSEPHENEMIIYERLLRNTETAETDMATILATAKDYEDIEQRLLAVAVPIRAAKIHLALLNAITSVHTHLYSMVSFELDPFRAAGGFVGYRNAATQLGIAIATLRLQVNIEGVSFPEGSAAALLMQL